MSTTKFMVSSGISIDMLKVFAYSSSPSLSAAGRFNHCGEGKSRNSISSYGEINFWTGQKMSRLKKDKWKGAMLSQVVSKGFDEQKLLDEDKEEMIKVNVTILFPCKFSCFIMVNKTHRYSSP